MAQAKLSSGGARVRPSAYRRWLVEKCLIKCLIAVVEDVCGMTIGQFPATVLYLGQRMPDVPWPEKVSRMRRAAWRMFASEVIPDSFTQRLETDLNLTLTEEKVPEWEGRLESRRGESAARSTEPAAPSATPNPTKLRAAGEIPSKAVKRDAQKAATRQVFMAPHLKITTLSGVATRSDVEHSSLYRWHTGQSRLSVENQAKLADYLKVNSDGIPN